MNLQPVRPVALATDLLETLEHTVAHAANARAFAQEAVSVGVRRVVLLGCGGSHYSTFPAQHLLETSSATLPSSRMTSAEFVHRDLPGVGAGTLVVASSHSGRTPETLEAVAKARALGALTVGIARTGQSPLHDQVDLALDYPSDVTVTEPKAIHFALIAAALLEANNEGQPGWFDAFAALPSVIASAKADFEELGQRIGQRWRTAKGVYAVAGGPNFGAANALAECYMQEMAWLHASAVHAADFFHGPFEVVGEHPVLVLIGEDSTRVIGERVVEFANRYYQDVDVIDSSKFAMPGVQEALRGFISPFVLASLSRRVLDFVAAERGHNTAVRRYMHRVAY